MVGGSEHTARCSETLRCSVSSSQMENRVLPRSFLYRLTGNGAWAPTSWLQGQQLGALTLWPPGEPGWSLCPIYRCGGPRPGRRGGCWLSVADDSRLPLKQASPNPVLTHTQPASWLLITDGQDILHIFLAGPPLTAEALTLSNPLRPLPPTPLLPNSFLHLQPAMSTLPETSLPETLECGREPGEPCSASTEGGWLFVWAANG